MKYLPLKAPLSPFPCPLQGTGGEDARFRPQIPLPQAGARRFLLGMA